MSQVGLEKQGKKHFLPRETMGKLNGNWDFSSSTLPQGERQGTEASSQNTTSVVIQLHPLRNVFLPRDVLPSLHLKPETKERIVSNQLFMEKLILIFASLVRDKVVLQLSYHG